MSKSYFNSNMKKLSNKYSQRKIAGDTGVSAASINNYLSDSSTPSLSFLMKLKTAYNINIDDFLFSDIDFNASKTKKNADKFIGNYMIYYYDSSAYKGRISTLSDTTLGYGVLSVKYKSGEVDPIVKAVFMRSRAETKQLFASLEKDGEKVLEKEDNLYIGKLDLTGKHFFINLQSADGTDHTSFIFNNPPILHNYLGGIGTANSVSRGRENMPCVQYTIISKKPINAPDGMIYNTLLLNTPQLDVKSEANSLINLFTNLFVSSEKSGEKLSEYQKHKIIEDSLKNIITDMIEQNMFRFGKISNMEDDECYRILREHIDENI